MVTGLMVGVEFAVAFVLNPIFNALPGDSGQLGRAHGGRMLHYLRVAVIIAAFALLAAALA